MTLRSRRGSALILVLMMTLAVAGLSIAAIFLSSSAGLLSRFYDRERDYRLAAESALEIAVSRLMFDTLLAVPDTGMRQLAAGMQIPTASGASSGLVRVNVYAATTGDTLGTGSQFVTLIASSYDASGTRHVRRLDLRRESFSRFAIFLDSFPSTLAHGPGVVSGRVHSNGSWYSTGAPVTFRDTVSTVGSVSGAATFDVDSIPGARRIRFPRDSTFLWMDTLAAAANLAITPVSGGGRGTRVELVPVDADGDGQVEADEGFVRVFDLASTAGIDTTRLRLTPPTLTASSPGPSTASERTFISWNNPIVQNQCGAFYLRNGRWHFIPVSAHRIPFVKPLLETTVAGDYPSITIDDEDDYDEVAVRLILSQATARCFPAGSPYLMLSERKTNAAGTVTGTAADVIPFGKVNPAGGWPASAPLGYGGGDTTFTIRALTCLIATDGTCAGAVDEIGAWAAFVPPSGSPAFTIPAGVRQATETPYLWRLGVRFNPKSRGIVSIRSGVAYLSGVNRGPLTVRKEGTIRIVDELRQTVPPTDPAAVACQNSLGLVASADILVVEGLATRFRQVGRLRTAGPNTFVDDNVIAHFGEGPRLRIDASMLSTGGTIGVENISTSMGPLVDQPRCPDIGGFSTRSNGGCLLLTGGAAMKRYSALYSGTGTGFRYQGIKDPCQATNNRPPFFPLTNRYTFVRTLEIEPSRANSPAKIRSILLRLKGKAL